MANKVSPTFNLPNAGLFQRVQDVNGYLQSLNLLLTQNMTPLLTRINASLQADGTEKASAPVLFAEYSKTALPSASTYKSGMIMVTDDVGGYTPAFADGTNWRRVADRNIIS